MSIWGKIIGGAAGFALGGPLGAVAGVLAGHAVDAMSADPRIKEDASEDVRQVAFSIAVIILSAKMAKADGVVTRVEVDAFKQVFQVPPEEAQNVAKIFDRAKRDPSGYAPYAQQVARLFRHEPAVLEEILDCLFHIARADGVYHPAEKAYLEDVARLLGFDANAFRRIEAKNMEPGEADPFAVLGVTRDASDGQIKSAYRSLIKEHHPDVLLAQGMPEDLIELANDKLAAINQAYDNVKKERGFV